MFTAYKNTFTSIPATRSEFWKFQATTVILYAIVVGFILLATASSNQVELNNSVSFVGVIFGAVTIISSLSVIIRRFIDAGIHWAFIIPAILIPYGQFAIFIVALLPTEEGDTAEPNN